MTLKALLLEKKSAVTKKWLNKICSEYPVDTSQFLRGQKDRFLNPVGHTFEEVIDGLFDQLVSDTPDSEACLVLLNDIIRIKAVQEFSPLQALSFIFLLKEVLYKELGKQITQQHLFDELRSIESNIDRMALNAFNIYMKCREHIYEIRVNELKTLTSRFLRRANLTRDPGGMEPEIGSDAQLTQKIKG